MIGAISEFYRSTLEFFELKVPRVFEQNYNNWKIVLLFKKFLIEEKKLPKEIATIICKYAVPKMIYPVDYYHYRGCVWTNFPIPLGVGTKRDFRHSLGINLPWVNREFMSGVNLSIRNDYCRVCCSPINHSTSKCMAYSHIYLLRYRT